MEMTDRELGIREMVMDDYSDIVRRAVERLMNQLCEEAVNVHTDIEEKRAGAFVSADEAEDIVDHVMDKDLQTEYHIGIIQRLLLEKLTE
jgi:hypothetical protein